MHKNTALLQAIFDGKLPDSCFVLDQEKFELNLQKLKYVQDEAGISIICALKGFSTYHSFGIAKNYLKGVTASSLNEVKLGDEEWGGEIHAYTPSYLPEEIDEIISKSTHVTFNSLSEYERYKDKICQNKDKSFGLRLNPLYSEVEVEKYNPCVPGSRFGVAPEMLKNGLPEGVEGVHFHALCEQGSDVLERVFEQVELHFGHLLKEAKWLNMGGGHAITREGYDISKLIYLLKRIKQKYDLEIVMEPGSAIGWETGYLVSRVLDKLSSGDVTNLMLNVSFATHMPDCLEMPYKPHVFYKESEAGKYLYNLGGLACYSGDFINDFEFSSPVEPGDYLVFHDMMHYTMVKSTSFNGIKLPEFGIWKDGEYSTVKKYGYDIFKNRL